MADYDVVIVGSGFAGANIAHQLGLQGKSVLILEAGPGLPRSREDYMENFYLNKFKSPSSPYPPNDNSLSPATTNAPRVTVQALVEAWDNPAKSYLTYSSGSLPFASSNERIAGGTGNHWMGTCLRMNDSDLKLKTKYTKGLDWPLTYSQLSPDYNRAEALIGVSADVTEQELIGTTFTTGYNYPMKGIVPSYWENKAKQVLANNSSPLTNDDDLNKPIVTGTPAGRNSQPYHGRRQCQGNTNCTPICPIQAKYDTQYGLSLALDTGNVTLQAKSVVDKVTVGTDGKINGVHYINYKDVAPGGGGQTGEGTVTGTIYVLAAHAIENAKILLNSPYGTGTVANSSDQVGRNLMDHPTYLAWGLANDPVYAYRGPISTHGVESLRDGAFRSDRAAWRIELGNAAWNWPTGDPYGSGLDFAYGTDKSQLNSSSEKLAGASYVSKMNHNLTRQFRIAFLVEQDPQQTNRVQLSSTHTDNLGIPRPLITYNFSDYTKRGFEKAKEAATEFIGRIGATEYTTTNTDSGTKFTYRSHTYNYAGAGHMCGTHIMGTTATNSVVNSDQKSWDHDNLYLAGCGSHPTVGTQNPTLTLVALALRTARAIVNQLSS